MNTFITERIFGKFDSQAKESCHASTQNRTIKDYQLSDEWGSFTSCDMVEGNIRPSFYNNPFAKDIHTCAGNFFMKKQLLIVN